MSVTISDVARHAGVSTATVSRYLNKSPKIAAKSAEKVQQAMEALKYHPSFVARSLANHSTSTVAFVVDSTNTENYGNDYFLRIQYGIEAALGKQGYYLLITNLKNNGSGIDDLRKLALEKRVEGLILPDDLAKRPILDMLREVGLPFVVIGASPSRDVNWVDIDNETGGKIATEHLVRTGCRHIAFITHTLSKSFVKDRYSGYRNALAAAGVPINEETIIHGCKTAEDGENAVYRLLCECPETDGLICTDNIVAFGVLRALSHHAIAVPGSMQVITFDNTFLTELSTPHMSVVDIDMDQLGRQAAEILVAAMQGSPRTATNSLLKVTLVLRGSTKD